MVACSVYKCYHRYDMATTRTVHTKLQAQDVEKLAAIKRLLSERNEGLKFSDNAIMTAALRQFHKRVTQDGWPTR